MTACDQTCASVHFDCDDRDCHFITSCLNAFLVPSHSHPRSSSVRISAKLIAPVVERDFAAGFDWVIEALKQPPSHSSEGGPHGTGLGSLNPALALHHQQQRGGMGMGMGGPNSAAAAAAAALGTHQMSQTWHTLLLNSPVTFLRRHPSGIGHCLNRPLF